MSVTLIGMPGCGKSTLGVLLAKELHYDFVDTDVAIQVAYGQGLQEIIEQFGYLHLRQLEEQIILALTLKNKVIATGGSAVYGRMGMDYLRQESKIIYLQVELSALERRLKNFSRRGIAAAAGATIGDILCEREPLYRQYADLVLNCGQDSPAQLLPRLQHLFNSAKHEVN